MSTNCKKSCGLCCQNSYPSDKDCKYWSGLGNCANNYAGWMDTNSKSSCGRYVAKILMAMILIVIIGLDLAIVPKLMSLG